MPGRGRCGRRRRLGASPAKSAADLRRVVSRAVWPKINRPGNAKVGSADAAGNAIQFRVVPGNGERDGGVQQRVEVKSAVCELPEIIGVDHQVFADGLLEAGVELVAAAG